LKNVSRVGPFAALLLLAVAAARSVPAATAHAAAAKKPAPAAPAKAPPRPPAGATLLVPPGPDTLPPESAPAPFIVPGQPIAVDSSQTREARARTYLAIADQLERKGQLSTALAAYQSALTLDTTLTGVAFHMGRMYQQMDDPARAARAFSYELKRDPHNLQAAIELAVSLTQMGADDKAIPALEALTRNHPEDDQAWSALGFAYHAAGREREAETAMRRAIELPPARASEHRDLGALLAAQGREHEARAEYQRAMTMDPNDSATWVNLGNLERRGEHYEKALEDYRTAEARDSSQMLALQGQALTLAALGRAHEAEAAYRRWIARKPADFTARLEAIQYFVSEGRSDAALEIARGAVRIDPHSCDARIMMGVALDASGDKRGALSELRFGQAVATDQGCFERAQQLIVTLRAGAPDSLRAMFAADSVKNEGGRR
jgi:tetratricopeptide (TPR) repeat protein